MSNHIWLNDPSILLNNKYLRNIWPISTMTPEEKVNSITRLLLLLSLIAYLLTFSFKMLYISIITIAIILIIYYLQKNNNFKHKNKKLSEGFSNKRQDLYNDSLNDNENYEKNKDNFSIPTASNPLMNVLLPEIYYDTDKKPAAPTFNENIEKNINKSVQEFIGKEFNDKNIDKKLFHDLGDKIAFDRSMLPFNATPNTQIPNDQKSFQEYLYGDMISGKEGNPTALERNNGGAYNYKLL